jgi:hypothetical protein
LIETSTSALCDTCGIKVWFLGLLIKKHVLLP